MKFIQRAGVFCCLVAACVSVRAQVVVDGSFGNAGALNGPNFNIPDTLGKTVGDNLFHSFSEFSLQTGQAATFTGPDSIQNILGRVTGANVSEIDGLIRSEITDANLYLLNPNGFLFGKNAKVDVDGAFTLSTRESLKLGEDGQFNAVNPERSVFTSAAPNAFGFLGENPGGSIKFSGTKLVVENPVGLVGGDIRLDDAVIYSKSEGKPTGVSIEGDNLSIVDSQIRNKSTLEVEGVQQGIAIELSGDLEITDTTITEADGSGVDRGDFIDEIGSDVPFASRVGLLGITEGFENPDPIAIKAKDAKIIGGGAYSVNVVTEGKRSAAVEASRIDVSTETLQMEQATLEVTTKMDGVEEVEITQTTTLTGRANSVKLIKPIFAQEGSVDVFLNGKRQREGRNYSLRFNQSGALEQVDFEEAIPEGAELKFVMEQNLTRSNLVVANASGEVSLVKNSKVTAGGVEMDVNRLSIDESHVAGSGSVGIHAETVLKLDNQSSVKANSLEQGSVQLTSDTILIDDQSLLAGSSRVALTAGSNVGINGESQVRVGWADARGPRQGSVKDILWDSNNGKVVDQNGLSPRGRFKDEASVIRKITSQYGNQGTINVIDINQPIDHAAVPHVSIKSGGISVENGSFTGDSGGIKSSIMMQSENGIRISGDSAFRQFDQVALNANSVEVLSGIDIESKSNRQDVYTGFLVVNSKEATTLSGGRLFGSLVVNAGTDISITDMELGYGETKLGSDVFKLDADGDIYLGSGELGVTGTAHSKMLNIEGRDVHIKGYGLMSQSGMGIIGSSRVELEGPAGIKTNAVGAQELVVKAPDVTIKEGVSIFAQLLPQQGLNVTGRVRISGVNSLNLKDSTVEAGSPQFFNETPVINLSGGQITLDNTSLSQYCHYDSPQMHGEIYVKNPSTLNGYKTTKISATGSFKLLNKSRIYMNIGQVVVNAEDISVENSEILSRNVRGPASGWVGRIELDARSAVNLTDAKLNSETISSGVRAEISLSGNSLNAENSEVRIFDEQKGKTGKIQLNFDESIKMGNSQILSVGSSHLTPNINGNDIIVKSKDLTMKDSLINGMVEGDGKEGKTRLDISGELSLEDSFVGGLAEPLKLVENEALITDGSLGEVKNLGVGTEIVIQAT